MTNKQIAKMFEKYYEIFDYYRNNIMWNEVTDAEYLRKVFNRFCKRIDELRK